MMIIVVSCDFLLLKRIQNKRKDLCGWCRGNLRLSFSRSTQISLAASKNEPGMCCWVIIYAEGKTKRTISKKKQAANMKARELCFPSLSNARIFFKNFQIRKQHFTWSILSSQFFTQFSASFHDRH